MTSYMWDFWPWNMVILKYDFWEKILKLQMNHEEKQNNK